MINKIKNLSYKKFSFRFPPDPNGFLHLGHLFSIIFNYILSILKKSSFILRFDNTNLSRLNLSFYHFITYDILWVGVKWNKIKYFNNLLKINKIILFYYFKIKKNYFKKKQNILRLYFNYLNYLKITEIINYYFYKKKNFSIFIKKKIIYRIKNKKNHNGFFPTYDFSQCFDDFFNNIKTSICTSEFKKNSKMYNYLLKNIISKPIQFEFEKKKFKKIFISKKKLKKKYFLNIFYFRKIKINPKKLFYFCNFLGINNKNSFIKNNNIKKIFFIEKKYFFFKKKIYNFGKIINIKKNIIYNIFNNNNNINLNTNIYKFNKIIKKNVFYFNYLNYNNFLIFKKKIFFINYSIYKKEIILIKKKILLKIKNFSYNINHCLYDNKLKYNKINLFVKKNGI